MHRSRDAAQSAKSMTIELICVGDELLSGITLNTNAHWLASEIARLGATLNRISVVGDSIKAIASDLSETLARKPDMIIVTGGLGATYDDLTLEGVAAARGKRTRLDPRAVSMLRKSYARRGLNYKLDSVRLKMATIPEGATPIQNPVGSAPAVRLRAGRTEIFCLQGVPSEMQAIFTKHIAPIVRKSIGPFTVLEENYEVEGISEAMIAPSLTRLVNSVPKHELYLKTHPRGYVGTMPRLRIQILCRGKDAKVVRKTLKEISASILKQVSEIGGRVVATALSQNQ